MFRKFFHIAHPAQDDLLAHPALQEMSLRELADLPLPRSTGGANARQSGLATGG